ncbi:MAG TPA: glycosyltransferase family 4 protein [Steroidobacteraceae bacterium]|nr:glycosyltransferase family 4 protein [Steroidobacteraceae bacterium]
MRPIRVLLAHCRYRERGGEDEVVESEAELLRSRGHPVELLLKDNRTIGSLKDAATAALWSHHAARETRALIAAFRPDVLHVHNTFPLLSPSIYWAAHREGVAVVQTLHNFRLFCAQAMFLRDGQVCEDCIGHLPWRGVLRRCYRDSFSQSAVLVGSLGLHRSLGSYRDKVTRYIALNEFCRRKFIAGGLPADKVVVKPNFANVDSCPPQSRAGGLFVGRLAPEKGVGTLRDALQDGSAAPFEIIGTGPEEGALRGLPRVRVLGRLAQHEVHARMRHATFLVLPSLWYENFPRVLIEAFACGLPVIASRIGALAELIEPGRTGLLFEPGSALELRQVIAWANANPARMEQMGLNARERYEAGYTPEINHRRLVSIYEDAIREIRQRRAA